MAKKIIPTMEELFETLKDVPEGFKENCMEYASPVPIFYRRNGKYADCRCGRCNATFYRADTPYRGEKTFCPECGVEGLYEWKRVTTMKREYFTVVLIQTRTDGNLVIRNFKCVNGYQQGFPQGFRITETVRTFLNMGDFWKFNHDSYDGQWKTSGIGIEYRDVLYPGWMEEIKNSNFKYFKRGFYGIVEELKAYARNPALEMFEKIGLKNLKEELIEKEGRSKYINRRGKSIKAQLRLKDKQRINFLIQKNGDLRLLRILQIEEQAGVRLNDEKKKMGIQNLKLLGRRKKTDWSAEVYVI